MDSNKKEVPWPPVLAADLPFEETVAGDIQAEIYDYNQQPWAAAAIIGTVVQTISGDSSLNRDDPDFPY